MFLTLCPTAGMLMRLLFLEFRKGTSVTPTQLRDKHDEGVFTNFGYALCGSGLPRPRGLAMDGEKSRHCEPS